MKINVIVLSQHEKVILNDIIHNRTQLERIIKREQVLLLAYEGNLDGHICKALKLSAKTVYKIHKCYHRYGLDRALYNPSSYSRQFREFTELDTISTPAVEKSDLGAEVSM